jgi:predicted O-methyltransferase YrrM
MAAFRWRRLRGTMKKPVYYRWTDYNLDLLPNAYLREQERGVGGPSEWVEKTGYSPGFPAWNLLYYALLCSLKPDSFNLIVETGTNIGSSTIILAQALKDSGRDGLVRTVEIEPANHERAKLSAEKAEVVDRIEFYLGNSLEMLPSMADQPVQIAFLDGNHLHDHVIHEFEIVLPRLKPDALVIFDNTYQIADEGEDPRVHGALKSIQKLHGGNLINFPIASWYTPGFAIWQKTPL